MYQEYDLELDSLTTEAADRCKPIASHLEAAA